MTYEGFARLLDDYEREHFGRDEGAHAVARAALAMLGRIRPHDRLRERLVRLASLSLLDAPLLDALACRTRCGAVRAGLRLRGRVLRWCPPRRARRYVRQGLATRL